MLKTVDIVIIATMAAAAVMTFHIKFQAEEQLAEVQRLEAAIRLEQDTIDLLEADWSLLIQPGRLQELVSLNNDVLSLQVTEAHQMVRPQELPAKVISLPEAGHERIAAAPDRDVITGSVER